MNEINHKPVRSVQMQTTFIKLQLETFSKLYGRSFKDSCRILVCFWHLQAQLDSSRATRCDITSDCDEKRIIKSANCFHCNIISHVS